MDKRPLYLSLVIVLVIGVLFTGVYGKRILGRIRSWWRNRPLPVSTEPVTAGGTYTNIIFLHHSTGANLIAQGNVREFLTQLGYQFWDHDYNRIGLTRPDGTQVGASYAIPELNGRATAGGNTDPEGLDVLFAQPVLSPPANAFSRLLQHEVIIVKSCFPNSAIESAQALADRKALYQRIRDVIDRHPDRLFIIMTTPPLHPLATNPEDAARARELAGWMASDEFLQGHPNLAVFDFYDLLADPETGMLRAEYQYKPDSSNSHPNELANKTIGPVFVEFIDQAVQTYRQSRASP